MCGCSWGIGARPRASSACVTSRVNSVDLVRVDSELFPPPANFSPTCRTPTSVSMGGRVGDTLTVVGEAGERAEFTLSGRGRSLPGGEQVQDEKRDRPLRAQPRSRQ